MSVAALRMRVGQCYRIAGRPPVVVMGMEYGTGKRTKISVYTPSEYEQYMKHYTYFSPDDLRTVAEAEGTDMPMTTLYRINSKTKIEEVDVRTLLPNSPYIGNDMEMGELKHKLSLPRRELV